MVKTKIQFFQKHLRDCKWSQRRGPYVSSQAWRRWLRDTSNEENIGNQVNFML
jgi:hypothetical protein